jgi:hypothetical protein
MRGLGILATSSTAREIRPAFSVCALSAAVIRLVDHPRQHRASPVQPSPIHMRHLHDVRVHIPRTQTIGTPDEDFCHAFSLHSGASQQNYSATYVEIRTAAGAVVFSPDARSIGRGMSLADRTSRAAKDFAQAVSREASAGICRMMIFYSQRQIAAAGLASPYCRRTICRHLVMHRRSGHAPRSAGADRAPAGRGSP